MPASDYAVTGSNNPRKQVSVDRWNAVMEEIDGKDAGLRTDLAAADGAGLVGHNAYETVAESLLSFGTSVAAYGALGDGATDDTSAINSAVAAASAIGAAASKMIRVRFPDDGIYMTDGILMKPYVHLDFGNATIRKRSNGGTAETNSILRAVPVLTGSTYYGTYKRMKITGGRLEANGFQCAANLVNLIYCEDLHIDDLTIVHSAGVASWALQLGGRNISFGTIRVRGGSELFQDGVHIYHGQKINGDTLDIESGDDALAIGGEPSEAILAADPDPIRYVNIGKVVTSAEKAVAIKVYIQADAPVSPDWEISDVTIDQITGTAGITRNGGITIFDQRYPAAEDSGIKRIFINDVSLDVGSSSHDGVNPYGLWAASVNGLHVRRVDIRTTSGAGTKFALLNVDDVIGSLDGMDCEALPEGGGGTLYDSPDFAIRNSKWGGASVTVSRALLLRSSTLSFENFEINGVPSGKNVLELTEGLPCNLKFRSVTLAQVAGATAGYAVAGVGSSYGKIDWADSDLSGSFEPFIAGSVGSVANRRIVNVKGADTSVTGQVTLTSASTSVTVTHAAEIAHSSIRQIRSVLPVTNWGAMNEFWITNGPGSSQFTINADVAPGEDVTFNYSVDVSVAPVA